MHQKGQEDEPGPPLEEYFAFIPWHQWQELLAEFHQLVLLLEEGKPLTSSGIGSLEALRPSHADRSVVVPGEGPPGSQAPGALVVPPHGFWFGISPGLGPPGAVAWRQDPARGNPSPETGVPLRSQVLDFQEKEWRRIAREIHDGLSQYLTALLLGLQVAAASRNLDEVLSHLAGLRRTCALAMADTCRLTHGLRPSILDDFGLGPALEQLAADFPHQAGPVITVKVSELGGTRLSARIETALFRIAQEALHNAVKHARAGTVHIDLHLEPGLVVLEVRDNGRGFQETTGTGLGLSTMRERAMLLNGCCTIQSAPEKGCGVTVRIPLQ